MSQRSQVQIALVWFCQIQREIRDLNIYRDCDLFVFSNVKNQRVFNHALVLCYILLRRTMMMMSTTTMMMTMILISIMILTFLVVIYLDGERNTIIMISHIFHGRSHILP